MNENPTRRHSERIDAVRAAVLGGTGVLPRELREAAARNEGVPERYASYVDAIHRHAYRITDRTVSDLRATGAAEDEVFEVTIAAAYGAAAERLDAGLRALRNAVTSATADPGDAG